LHVNLLWSAQEKSNSKTSGLCCFLTVDPQSNQAWWRMHAEEFSFQQLSEKI
jgi:hypothetical protein